MGEKNVSSLFDQIQLRDDVRVGELTEGGFAASLEAVAAGEAEASYLEAGRFFASTYPSGGLKTLLNEALGRLGGARPDGASIIRLETSLGGGKTHNLIALLHAARGDLAAHQAAEFMDPSLLPSQPIDRIGVFVGTSVGGGRFPEVAGIEARTPWGYLALQLRGTEGYDLLKAEDESLTAPGSARLAQLLGDRPTLFLVDEIARYYEVAKGVRVGDSTLARQTTAFLMALMEAVDSHPRACLIITTTQVTDAFGEGTADVLAAIEEARSLIARKELVLHPSEEADLPRILARRLFEPIPAGTATATATAYAEAADAAEKAGFDLPEHMTGPAWASELSRTYPFHPSLIRVLDKRLSTIPNFQRTRGALRLLARVARRMAAERTATDLIHLHHVDLADPAIAADLSSRLGRSEFEPVIRADIAGQTGGEPAHAETVDVRLGAGYARRLAITTYLYSLTRDVPAVPATELFAAVLAPGDDTNLMHKALDGLEKSCWYLHADARGFRFSTEASLVKLIQEAEAQVAITAARDRATALLAEQYKDGALKVRRAWEDAKVPDNAADAWLVLLHWDDFPADRGVDPTGPVPDKITQLWEKTPSGGVRQYRNRLLFLAPSAASHEAMIRAVRTHLALDSLARNADTLAALGKEKADELRAWLKESTLTARVAVANHVNVLYVPTAAGLDVVECDPVTTASVRPNQTDAVVERLAAMDKTLAAGDKPMDPGYVKAKLGAQLASAQPTAELERAFARRADLKLVLDRAQLVNLITAGVRNGHWEYEDPQRGIDGWATQERPTAHIRLAEDTFLHPLGSAPTAPTAQCAFGCGKPVHPGRDCDDSPAETTGPIVIEVDQPPSPSTFTGTGAAGPAFADARARAAAAGRATLTGYTVRVDHLGSGAGTELARLHTLAPTTGAAQVVFDVNATVALSAPAHSAAVTFRGTPGDWTPLRDAVKNLLGPREATLQATVTVEFPDPPALSGDAVEQLLRAAGDTGPSTCTVTLHTAASS
jgi:hypothetical protein